MTRLNIGIVGLGRLGKRHAQNLCQHIANVRLIAAASPETHEQQYAQQTLNIPHVYTTLEELLTTPELDAVVLATPTDQHAQQSIQVLQAGKHLLVEKPLALNLADCQIVEKTYQQTQQRYPKQIAMVGFVRRFDPHYLAAKASIDAGKIGQPFYIRSQTCDKFDPSGFFVEFSQSSGGIILDCNIHDIDLARWLLADKHGNAPTVRHVYASGTCAKHPELSKYQDVDNAISTIVFTNGQLANLYASRTFAHGHETSSEIIATDGKLLVGLGAMRHAVIQSDAHGVTHHCFEDFFARFEQAFINELQAFSNACLGKIPPPLTLNDATEATRIAIALTQSLRSGQIQNLTSTP